MSTEPRAQLYDDVAGQLERGDAVMPLQWIQDRNVSYDELNALQRRLALILRGYAAMKPSEQIAFVTRGVLKDMPTELDRLRAYVDYVQRHGDEDLCRAANFEAASLSGKPQSADSSKTQP